MNANQDWHQIAIERARQLAEVLKQRGTDRVVFAESCTCGLVAAVLAQVPGISNFLCGSAVTYRESVKQNWLEVSAETLARHTAESIETTFEMAQAVLAKTDEATWSAAVTGHLGPGAPPEVDGRIFVVVAKKAAGSIGFVLESSFQLLASSRVERQSEAASIVLKCLAQEI